ncbi:hypothetical protein L218DRAFT_884347, partial [Marasmius fiardii PR-910]
RYKIKRSVMPSTIVPEPKKPKNTDSFMFSVLHHVSALQCEGLHYWMRRKWWIQLQLWLETADGPALSSDAGLVGHSEKFGYRVLWDSRMTTRE